ncbi:MAG: Formamidase, partial [uncultured Phycisphaerae bacterium]
EDADQGRRGRDAGEAGRASQPVAPGHPDGRNGQARRRVPRRVRGLDRRADQERRLGHGREGRRPHQGPLPERADRGRGRRTRRPDGRRHPGRRRAAFIPVGLHRPVRQGERRRLPDRPLPEGAEGVLGLPRHLHLVAPHPARRVRRHYAPGTDRLPALEGTAGEVEHAREEAVRHQPDPRPPAGRPALRRDGAHGPPEGRGRPDRGVRGRAHRPAARARRQLRHQEPHPRLQGVLPRVRQGRRALDGRHPLLPRRRRDHVLRRDRDGRLPRHPREPDQGRRREVRHPQPGVPDQPDGAALHDPSRVRGHQRRRAGRTALPRPARQLPHGVPQRHRVPQEVRLHRRAGLRDPRHRPGRGADQRHRRHPQRRRHALRPHRDLRLRHPPQRERPREVHQQHRPGDGGV